MPLKLADQRKIASMLTVKDLDTIAAVHKARRGTMSGKGLWDTIKSVGIPLAKELGPVLLEKFILPKIKQKLSGNGIRLSGTGLRLAGARAQRGRGKAKAKPKAPCRHGHEAVSFA